MFDASMIDHMPIDVRHSLYLANLFFKIRSDGVSLGALAYARRRRSFDAALGVSGTAPLQVHVTFQFMCLGSIIDANGVRQHSQCFDKVLDDQISRAAVSIGPEANVLPAVGI